VGATVNINTVINKLNADHLDERKYFSPDAPVPADFVWNNLIRRWGAPRRT